MRLVELKLMFTMGVADDNMDSDGWSPFSGTVTLLGVAPGVQVLQGRVCEAPMLKAWGGPHPLESRAQQPSTAIVTAPAVCPSRRRMSSWLVAHVSNIVCFDVRLAVPVCERVGLGEVPAAVFVVCVRHGQVEELVCGLGGSGDDFVKYLCRRSGVACGDLLRTIS